MSARRRSRTHNAGQKQPGVTGVGPVHRVLRDTGSLYAKAVSGPERIDVSDLPEYAFGHRSLMWWGTMGVIVIEGTIFALAMATHLYLASQAGEWPPGVPPPSRHAWLGRPSLLLCFLCSSEGRRVHEAVQADLLRSC